MTHAVKTPARYFSMEKGFDGAYLVREIDKIRTINDNRVSFKAGEYHSLLPILVSAITATFQAHLGGITVAS